MRAVNLLPDAGGSSWRDSSKHQLRAIAIGAGACSVLIAALLAFAGVHLHGVVNDRSQSLATLNAELGTYKQAAAAAAAARAQNDAHLAAFSTAVSGRVQWDGLLDDLSRAMPRGSWLSALKAQSPVPANLAATSSATTTPSIPATPSAGVPTAFTVTGYALSQEVVARSLERLTLIPMLSDVTLQSSVRSDIGKRSAYLFTIGANVRSPGGTP